MRDKHEAAKVQI